MTIGVLICSYQRPDSLMRGLHALAKQECKPDDVIVVARRDDAATLTSLASLVVDELPWRVVTVAQPGLLHARNAGLDACRTDLLAITDDDTVPHPDWLARIVAHFAADPKLGGLGGRDWCHDGERIDDRSTAVVGLMKWFGLAIGNHHLGAGEIREVDFLKGANMSYRVQALKAVRFDTRLRGFGSTPMEDMAISCGVKRAGWKLLYDPLVALDHYTTEREEPRHYVDVTADMDMAGLFDCAHNEVVARWDSLHPVGRAAYVVWSFLIGTSISPGLIQGVRYTRRLGISSWYRFWTVQRGKAAALRTVVRSRRVFGSPSRSPQGFKIGRIRGR